MNYDQRIAALTSFKSTVSGAGDTVDGVSGTSSEVAGWEGDARNKFDDYIEDVKSDSKVIAKRKSEFLTAVDGQISALKNQLALEVEMNKFVLYTTYDSKSPSKNRILKRQAVNSLSVDESVKLRLLRLI